MREVEESSLTAKAMEADGTDRVMMLARPQPGKAGVELLSSVPARFVAIPAARTSMNLLTQIARSRARLWRMRPDPEQP